MPLWAKSRIIVLENQEDRDWSKSERFAPVLRFDSLRFFVSLAVQCRRGLKQGNCKNAFCPLCDLDAPKDEYWLLQKTLYGLHCSPWHWY